MVVFLGMKKFVLDKTGGGKLPEQSPYVQPKVSNDPQPSVLPEAGEFMENEAILGHDSIYQNVQNLNEWRLNWEKERGFYD